MKLDMLFSLQEYLFNPFRFWTSSSSTHQQIITFNQVKQPFHLIKCSYYEKYNSSIKILKFNQIHGNRTRQRLRQVCSNVIAQVVQTESFVSCTYSAVACSWFQCECNLTHPFPAFYCFLRLQLFSQFLLELLAK